MRIPGKRLVIDANIAYIAGDIDAPNPASQLCRELLLQVRNCGHRIVMHQEMQVEWRNHQSRFSSLWLANMEKLGKKDDLPLPANEQQREAMIEFLGNEERAACTKDCHLIEAALATDDRVVSCDENARRRFARVGKQTAFDSVGKIVWTNPVNTEAETPIPWLEGGAPDEVQRRLENFEKKTRKRSLKT